MVLVYVHVDVPDNRLAHSFRAVQVSHIYQHRALILVFVKDLLGGVLFSQFLRDRARAGFQVVSRLLCAFVYVIVVPRVIAHTDHLYSGVREFLDRFLQGRVDALLIRPRLRDGCDNHHGLRLTLQNFFGDVPVKLGTFVRG